MATDLNRSTFHIVYEMKVESELEPCQWRSHEFGLRGHSIILWAVNEHVIVVACILKQTVQQANESSKYDGFRKHAAKIG